MKRKNNKGYTLVEIMFVVLVFTVAMGMTIPFLTEIMRSIFVTEGRNLINGDIRQVTSKIADDTRQASYYRIYESFTNLDQRNSGTSGDFFVLVYLVDQADDDGWAKESGVMTLRQPRQTDRIVGYYRNADASNQGPVTRVEWELPTARKSDSLASILAALPDAIDNGSASQEEVLELAEGLANQQLFYNYMDRSIMVNGNIVHGNENVREITNTYNFTVSPKGKSNE